VYVLFEIGLHLLVVNQSAGLLVIQVLDLVLPVDVRKELDNSASEQIFSRGIDFSHTPYHLGTQSKVVCGVEFFFVLGCLILILCEMSLHDDSDLDGGEIPLSSDVTEDLRIHLMSIKGANKKLRTKVEDMSANIVGVEDKLNVRLTTSDRQRDDSLRVVTESLNRLTAAVQRLEARDATPRQSRSPRHGRNQSDVDVSDLFDARGGYQRRLRRVAEVHHGAGQRRNQGGEAAPEDGGLGRIKLTIPEYSGRSDPEKYLEWEMRVNQIFDGHNYSEENKVRVASMEFTECALVWWDNKNRTGERPATWVDMKCVMREMFVPACYTR
jgi:hypothetical protein